MALCGKGERHGDGTHGVARAIHCPSRRLSIRTWCLELIITSACIIAIHYYFLCFCWNSALELRAFFFLLVPLIRLRNYYPERLTGRAVLRTTVARGGVHIGKAAASFLNQPGSGPDLHSTARRALCEGVVVLLVVL